MLSAEEIKFFRHYNGFPFDALNDPSDEFNALAAHYGWEVGTVVWVRHHNKFTAIKSSRSPRSPPKPTPFVVRTLDNDNGIALRGTKDLKNPSNALIRYGASSPDVNKHAISVPQSIRTPYPNEQIVGWPTNGGWQAVRPNTRRARAQFYAAALDFMGTYMQQHHLTIPQAVCLDLGVNWGDVAHIRGTLPAGTSKLNRLSHEEVRGLSNTLCRKMLCCVSINIKDYVNTWFPIYRPDLLPYILNSDENTVGAVIGPVFRSRVAFMNHMKKLGRTGMFDGKLAKPQTPPGMILLRLLLHRFVSS